MAQDRPDDRPHWRNRVPRLNAQRNARADRPWYADRLERSQGRATRLGPYEMRYTVQRGYDEEPAAE